MSKGAVNARNNVVNHMPTSLGFDFRKFKQNHQSMHARKIQKMGQSVKSGSVFSAPHLPRVKQQQ
jgi:hypothetical protein